MKRVHTLPGATVETLAALSCTHNWNETEIKQK